MSQEIDLLTVEWFPHYFQWFMVFLNHGFELNAEVLKLNMMYFKSPPPTRINVVSVDMCPLEAVRNHTWWLEVQE